MTDAALSARAVRDERLRTARMIVVGDSHSQFWSGQEGPSAGEIIPGVATAYISAGLAYNLIKTDSTSGTGERVSNVLTMLSRKRTPPDFLMFSFGEIDIRSHVLKQAALQELPLVDVLASVVRNYVTFLTERTASGSQVLAWGPPASRSDDSNVDHRLFPFTGTERDRNQATVLFHDMMQEAAAQSNGAFKFLTILPHLLTEDGLTRNEYFYDTIHLGQVAMPLALDCLEASTGWRPG